ncbi:MAG: hypothetical protein QOE26_1356 [Verrucomicrobiota bacterium]|jgi:integrase
MPRRPSLEPKKTTKPHAPWVVNLPPSLSSRGVRERRYFDSRKVGEEFCKQQRIRLENFGTASTLLSAGKVEEAAGAFDRLKGTGATLTEAVEHFLKWRRRQAGSVSFKLMLERVQEAKKEASRSYRNTLRYALSRFSELHDRLVSDLAPDDIEPFLTGATVSIRRQNLVALRAAFNFAIKRRWCDGNPILLMEIGSLKPKRETLTNDQVKALLKAALENDLELLPYVLLCLFAGIRPEEVRRLPADDINMDERFIIISDEVSKTGRRRVIEMEPLLVRWLEFYLSTGGKLKPGTLAAARDNLRKRLRALRDHAGIKPWVQDGPRRTFASCWLAMYEDVNRLNNLMGHTDPTMLFRHYNRAVTKKDAAAFWAIEPPSRSAKKPFRRVKVKHPGAPGTGRQFNEKYRLAA